MPFTAPSKEEKLLRVNAILSEIKELIDKEQTEVFAIDESHFSTEPYLIKILLNTIQSDKYGNGSKKLSA